jgi:hypothetical protein
MLKLAPQSTAQQATPGAVSRTRADEAVLLEDQDVVLAGPFDRIQWNRSVESDETPLPPNGKREQINVTELTRPVNSSAIDHLGIQKADVVRPEVVVRARARLRQAFRDHADW